MRISLWQQFSSNHSAEYTVVGTFASSDEAQAAGAKVKQVIEETMAWYEEHRAELASYEWQPSPVEAQAAAEYGFDWAEPVDWLRHFPRFYPGAYQHEPIEHVITFDRLVFVFAPEALGTWQTGHQFANLLRALGGEVSKNIWKGQKPDGDVEIAMIRVGITAVMPSVEIAAQIKTEFDLHIAAWKQLLQHQRLIPWIIYHPYYADRTGNMPSEEFLQAELGWIRGHSTRGRDVFPEELKPGLDQTIGYLRLGTQFSGRWCNLEDTEIHLDYVVSQHLATAFPAFVGWLKASGCSHLEFDFRNEGVSKRDPRARDG